MSHLIVIEPVKTFKTKQIAIKKAEEMKTSARYFIMQSEDGRFFPVFVGDQAVLDLVHFRFNCIG